MDIVRNRYGLGLILTVFLLMLVACGGGGQQVAPTATPRPPQLLMVFHPPAPLEDPAAAQAFADDVQERIGITMEVRIVDSPGAALDAICNPDVDLPVAAWLDGLTYIAAEARECGRPFIQVARTSDSAADTVENWLVSVNEAAELNGGDADILPDDESVAADETPEANATATPEPSATPEPTVTPEPTIDATGGDEATIDPDVEAGADLVTGIAGEIVVFRGLGTTNLSVVSDRNFCRLSIGDLYSWLLPNLAVATVNIDLLRSTADVIDFPDIPSMLTAVSEGDCAMTGIAAGTLDVLGDEAPPSLTVAHSTPPIAFGVLIYTLDMPLNQRLALDKTLLEMAEESDGAALLRPLLGQDALVAAQASDFDDLRQYINATGLDFAELGD